MDNNIDISLEIDPGYSKPQIIIRANEKTKFIEKIIEAIENCHEPSDSQIAVYNGDSVTLLEQDAIYRVYTQDRRLCVCSADNSYVSKLPLQDFEKLLLGDSFVRISRFEVVNLKKVSGFDLSIAGTIRITFNNGSETWVARRYVRDIQKALSNMRGGGRHE
jgi:DNA-binding LytR/AlgR family response regulator